MRLHITVLAAALALMAGCEKGPDKAPVNTPTTPANVGQPSSQEEKNEGANPVQGQVDPKQAEQHNDFQQSGDAAGPKGPGTMPKPGG
jgi:hypothetical protein